MKNKGLSIAALLASATLAFGTASVFADTNNMMPSKSCQECQNCTGCQDNPAAATDSNTMNNNMNNNTNNPSMNSSGSDMSNDTGS